METKQHPLWKNALAEFLKAGFKPGDLIPNKWFWEQFGLEMPGDKTPYDKGAKLQFQFLAAFSAFQKELLNEHMIDLGNVYGKGYRWIPAHEQTREAYTDGVKEIRTGIKRMAKRLERTNTALLTADQRKENSDALAKLAWLESAAKRKTLNRVSLSNGKE